MTEEPRNSTENLIGKELDDKYFIVGALGKGAMGAVYEALHTGIDRKLAVKVLNPDIAENEEILERFNREARLTSKLGHKNIIEITDTGTTPSGSPYIVMEFLEGQALGQAIFSEAPFSPEDAVGTLAYVLDALAVVHDAGVIHRDIKPDNIFLSEQGRPGKGKTVVKLLDFGISKPIDAEGPSTLTQTGVIMGTPYYMAPEQVRGKELDRRADLYAVGVILYEMLTSRLPFEGDNFGDLFASIITNEPAKPSELVPGFPPELDGVVLKAFAREKENRYTSADELLAALAPFGPPGLIEELCDSRGVHLGETFGQVLEPADDDLEVEPTGGNRLLLAALGVVALLMIGFAGFLILGGENDESSSTNADEAASESEPETTSTDPSLLVPTIEVSRTDALEEPGSDVVAEGATHADGGANDEQDTGASAAESHVKARPLRGGRADGKRPRPPTETPPRPSERPSQAQQMEIDTSLPPAAPPPSGPIQEIDLAPPPPGKSKNNVNEKTRGAPLSRKRQL